MSRAAARRLARAAVIRGATLLDLDGLERRRERRDARRTAAPVVRVLFMHATPRRAADRLRRRLAWIRRRFTVIDFEMFKRILAGAAAPATSASPCVLLTFDDGLASNYEVAAPMLEAAGLHGLFFVVPGFSLLTGAASASFYRRRLKGARIEPAMTPAQIADIAARGHTIGNHTFSHPLLSQLDPASYAHEIHDSASLVESWTGREVEAFAWPFVWDGITRDAHRMAAARHRYCFSPCAGRMTAGDAPELIWRTNVEPHHAIAEIRFQCSPLSDRASARRRHQLRQRLLFGERPRQERP